MFERFTKQSRRAIVLAEEEARSLRHNYIGTEHMLLGLLREENGAAARVLASAGIALPPVRHEVEIIIGRGQQAPAQHIPFTPRAKKCLELSFRESSQLGHNYIGTGHLLLGLISEGDGVAITVLGRLGADLNSLRDQVIREQERPEDHDDVRRATRPVRIARDPQQLLLRSPDAVLALLERIDERLSRIERHLGITGEDGGDGGESGGAGESGGPENVVPPS